MTSSSRLFPRDELNLQLERHVHPPDWKNPTPADRYHLVVIGAGTAGLVAAAGAAGLGAKVALVERDLMGGDCLNFGCVPSKALLSAAKMATLVRHAAEFGADIDGPIRVDFPRVMQRMRRLRAAISPHDSAQRFQSLGIDVFFGQARLTSPDCVDVEGLPLRFRRAVIATGSRPRIPAIPGLTPEHILTSDNLFSLTELPRRLVVVGGGPIGMEMAQAFAAFGSEVTLVEAGPRLLPNSDPDAVSLVTRVLTEQHGLQILLNAEIRQFSVYGTEKQLTVNQGSQQRVLACDAVLIATGRTPNIETLQAEQAGVCTDAQRGIEVNDFLQTTNPRIYASGDVCTARRFTHAADFMSRIVIQNALFCGRARVSRLRIPSCTYTSPELAHVGLSSEEAARAGIAITTITQPLAGNDRALLDGQQDGFVRMHLQQGTDRILGATIVGAHAGDMISEVSVAMAGGLRAGRLASVIHPYPTQADAIRRLGDVCNRTRLTPLIQRLFRAWLTYRPLW